MFTHETEHIKLQTCKTKQKREREIIDCKICRTHSRALKNLYNLTLSMQVEMKII